MLVHVIASRFNGWWAGGESDLSFHMIEVDSDFRPEDLAEELAAAMERNQIPGMSQETKDEIRNLDYWFSQDDETWIWNWDGEMLQCFSDENRYHHSEEYLEYVATFGGEPEIENGSTIICVD